MPANAPSLDRLRDVFNVVERTIESRYGLPVRITDVPSPFTGDLDGAEIVIDYDQDPSNALFVLIHLFGHTVQWNTQPRLRELGMLPLNHPWNEAELAEVASYELRACQYSMRLLHDVGVHDLDQWLSDFAACDNAYLMHLYRTGEKRPFLSFWRDRSPLLQPIEIPSFSPQVWKARSVGIVV